MRIAPVSAAALIVLGACRPVPAAAPEPAAKTAPEGQTLAQFQERIAEGFGGLDADGDGTVTAAELNGASSGMAAPMLARLDADGDAKVTQGEMAAGAERMFKRMDANGDGVVSPDERPGIGRSGRRDSTSPLPSPRGGRVGDGVMAGRFPIGRRRRRRLPRFRPGVAQFHPTQPSPSRGGLLSQITGVFSG